MKLCPQCDFIYEDDQAFCDMDGNELVFTATTPLVDENLVSTKPRDKRPRKLRVRHFAVLFAAVALLASLLSVIYLAQRRQLQTLSVQSSTRPVLSEPVAESSPAASIANAVIDASLQGEAKANVAASPVSPPTETNVVARRLETSAHAKDAAIASGSSPVTLRLTNGAVIKADDAGQTKTGVWYRQGGMVTFLKRGQVKAIERDPVPRLPKPSNKMEKTGTGQAAVAQNRLGIRRLEPVAPRSPSRVASVFKKTGQILSKPFKR
jgi:hypothetical protein